MNVLLTGASGFIGSHLSVALRAAGHVVIEARRNAGDAPGAIGADFTQDLLARNWLPKLAGVDAVINAVGIIREHGEQTFERIHKLAPQALFAACVATGVRRVVQISALGAGRGMTRYFVSKRAADDYLATLPLEWTIVQPSLVYGTTGASARLFTMLASLPLVPLPGRGEQRVQPIHIDDLSDAVVRLLADNDLSRSRIALVGPQALPLRELLSQLRVALQLRPARFISIPMPLMRAGARLAEVSPHSSLDRETLSMLAAGNTADSALTHFILRRPPRPASSFIDARTRAVAFLQAQCMWLLPILRLSVAAVWLWTAVVSLWLYPRAASYELLVRLGIPRPWAPWFLFGAAALDLSLGIGTLLLRKRRLLWLAQLAVIVGFTVILSIQLPELWLHPFGTILKNLPMLAAISTLYALERHGTAQKGFPVSRPGTF
jgi:uncharacterized protein YbjT (DUF2867 family)